MNDIQISKILDKHKLKIHISHNVINDLEISEQEIITGFNSGGRPEGIWYSSGGAWIKFLVDNTGKLSQQYKPCCYLYHVITGKKILKLDTLTKLRNFDKSVKGYWRSVEDIQRGKSYMYNLPFTPQGRSLGVKRDVNELIREGKILTTVKDVKDGFIEDYNKTITTRHANAYRLPRWDLIAKKNYGAEFIPYLKEYTKEKFWYWTIDAASGCVWDPRGIKSFELFAVKLNNKWKITDYGKKLIKINN